MSFVLFVLILLFNSISLNAQRSGIRELNLYEVKNKDTIHFSTIKKGSKGYMFFMAEKSNFYFKLKDSIKKSYDTVKEVTSISYGPYAFLKKGKKLVFREVNKGRKFRELYELSEKPAYAPELFSSSPDSYSLLTYLIGSKILLETDIDVFHCYKFSQRIGEKDIGVFRILYIDSDSLLPIKLEYYSDSSFKNLKSEIIVLRKNPGEIEVK